MAAGEIPVDAAVETVSTTTTTTTNDTWLEALARRAVPPDLRRYESSLFRLHFAPAPVLRLQAAVLRRAFPPDPGARPLVLYYSRGDCDKRHVASEAALLAALDERFDGRIEVLPWQGGATPDVERAARDWSRAALVVGPHGAGLANMIHCQPGTTVLVLPAADAAGAPSASDDYFVHFARALDLDLNFFRIDSPPAMFHNYSRFSDVEVASIVDAAERALFPPVRT